MNIVNMQLHIYIMRNMESAQLLIDSTRLQREIQARGFPTVKSFADSIGVHRNTVGNYLAGKTALPGTLARMLEALDLAPAEVLSLSQRRKQVPGLSIANLISTLHTSVPEAAFVLFGSRARGTAKRYSDYDIGVYHPDTMAFAVFSRLLDEVSAWNDESLVVAQLVDLTRADTSFLTRLAEDVVFLAGSHTSWCDLLQTAGVQLYE